MQLQVQTPVQVRVGQVPTDLAAALTYRDKSVDYELRRLKGSAYRYAADPEGYADALEKLEAARDKCLLFQDEEGAWTYSGLAPKLASAYDAELVRAYEYPAFTPLALKHQPDHEPWPHQAAAKAALLEAKHAAVEIAPGLGKSDIIEALVREVGLKALVAAPSTSIAEQLYRQLSLRFGQAVVGKYYGGKKEPGKRVVVGTAQSLFRVPPGSPHWKLLASSRVLACDESHLFAAECLSKIALELAAGAEYRWFFSGTQLRADGADLLLEGVTGPVVYRMSTREGVDAGYLAEPKVRVINCDRASPYESSDPARMTREHLYKNPNVLKAAAWLTNRFVSGLKRPTLILVDEVEQFSLLLSLLRVPVAFAHGPLTETVRKRGRAVPGNASKVPEEYRECDVGRLVADFNAGKVPVLVGTSCVSTGTDILAAEAVLYLVGGQSEVAVRQAMGRGTRGGAQRSIVNPWTGKLKKDCFFVDFDVPEVQMIGRHARGRRSIYRSELGEIEEVRWAT
jgi:superfamily II DNA or RNA helicase